MLATEPPGRGQRHRLRELRKADMNRNFAVSIDDSNCNRTHSSLKAVYCFDDGHMGKQPVACKEYCAEYWQEDLRESMDRYTGCRNTTEIMMETTLTPIKSNQLSYLYIPGYKKMSVLWRFSIAH